MAKPHEVLGLPATATKDEAKEAYRRLAMQHHPDRGGDVEQFQAIKVAYELFQRGKCELCKGEGYVETKRGYFTDRQPCPKCWKTT